MTPTNQPARLLQFSRDHRRGNPPVLLNPSPIESVEPPAPAAADEHVPEFQQFTVEAANILSNMFNVSIESFDSVSMQQMNLGFHCLYAAFDWAARKTTPRYWTVTLLEDKYVHERVSARLTLSPTPAEHHDQTDQ